MDKSNIWGIVKYYYSALFVGPSLWPLKGLGDGVEYTLQLTANFGCDFKGQKA
jgi:hypothetical protein